MEKHNNKDISTLTGARLKSKMLDEDIRNAERIPCKVCMFMDNDWPSRNGLCLECFSHEYVTFTTSGMTSSEALENIRRKHYRFNLNAMMEKSVHSFNLREFNKNAPSYLTLIATHIHDSCRKNNVEDIKKHALNYILMPESPYLSRYTADRLIERLETWKENELAKLITIENNDRTTCKKGKSQIIDTFNAWNELALAYKKGLL